MEKQHNNQIEKIIEISARNSRHDQAIKIVNF